MGLGTSLGCGLNVSQIYMLICMYFLCSVISGHMNGSLHLIGHSGILQHSFRPHRKPISVMRCTGDRVVTGSYDAVVKVHQIPNFFLVNSVCIHNGGITALAMVEVSS